MLVMTVVQTKKLLRKLSVIGYVTAEMREEFFKGCGFKEIRDWLESQGLNRHMMIQLESTEVAILTPKGLMMQIRRTDRNQLGFWGGVIEDGETPLQGAVRELLEEAGLTVEQTALKFVGIDNHEHKYANGDEALFHAYRYELRLNYVPEIKETDDDDTIGVFYLSHTVLSHQREWAISLLEESFS